MVQPLRAGHTPLLGSKNKANEREGKGKQHSKSKETSYTNVKEKYDIVDEAGPSISPSKAVATIAAAKEKQAKQHFSDRQNMKGVLLLSF